MVGRRKWICHRTSLWKSKSLSLLSFVFSRNSVGIISDLCVASDVSVAHENDGVAAANHRQPVGVIDVRKAISHTNHRIDWQIRNWWLAKLRIGPLKRTKRRSEFVALAFSRSICAAQRAQYFMSMCIEDTHRCRVSPFCEAALS